MFAASILLGVSGVVVYGRIGGLTSVLVAVMATTLIKWLFEDDIDLY
jgi:hypothetical protein